MMGQDVPSLGPLMRVPLEACADGAVYPPEVAFDTSESLLVIHQPVAALDWMKWARWHAPDAALFVGIAAAAMLMWGVRRIVHRPRRAGRVYCRRCNYELNSGEDGRAWPGRCPECGESPVRISVGWGAARRALLLCFPSVVLLAASFGALWWSVVRVIPVAGSAAWPGEWWGKIAPSMRMSRAQDCRLNAIRVTVCDLTSGRKIRSEPVRSLTATGWAVSADRRWYAAVENPVEQDFGASLVLVPLGPGSVRRVRLTGGWTGGAQCVGFSDDGRAVYVGVQSPDPFRSGEVPYRSDLMRVDIETGVVSIVVSVPTEWMVEPQGFAMRTQRFLISRDSVTEPRWVLFTDATARGGGTNGLTCEVFAGIGPEIERRSTMTLPATWWYEPSISSDGAQLVLPLGQPGCRALIDLSTLSFRGDPGGAVGARECCVVVEQPMTGRTDVVWITRGGARTRLAMLEMPVDSAGAVMLSPASNWATSHVMKTSGTGRPVVPPDNGGELHVWDLRSVLPAGPDAP